MRARIDELPPVSVAQTLALGAGIVDLWWWRYEIEEDPKLWAAYEHLMSPDERERHEKYRFERDRRLFAATRALVRRVLSRYAAVAPADWRFAPGARGKPHIFSPIVAPAIHFNLANTPGLVACAVSVAHEKLGVDAEQAARDAEVAGIADRYFAPLELRELQALPVSERLRRFTAFWVLKESYLKACGVGLELPLDRFRFLIGDAQVGIVFDSPSHDDANRWRFALIDLPPHQMIAVGAETGGADLSLRAVQLPAGL